MSEQLEKPLPPGDNECCESGACTPCVWDRYYTDLQQWRVKQSALNEKQKTIDSESTD